MSTTILKNEIDGQAFSELTEDDIRTMTKKLGVVKKMSPKSVSVSFSLSRDVKIDVVGLK